MISVNLQESVSSALPPQNAEPVFPDIQVLSALAPQHDPVFAETAQVPSQCEPVFWDVQVLSAPAPEYIPVFAETAQVPSISVNRHPPVMPAVIGNTDATTFPMAQDLSIHSQSLVPVSVSSQTKQNIPKQQTFSIIAPSHHDDQTPKLPFSANPQPQQICQPPHASTPKTATATSASVKTPGSHESDSSVNWPDDSFTAPDGTVYI